METCQRSDKIPRQDEFWMFVLPEKVQLLAHVIVNQSIFISVISLFVGYTQKSTQNFMTLHVCLLVTVILRLWCKYSVTQKLIASISLFSLMLIGHPRSGVVDNFEGISVCLSVCMYICLSDDNFRNLWHTIFLFFCICISSISARDTD